MKELYRAVAAKLRQIPDKGDDVPFSNLVPALCTEADVQAIAHSSGITMRSLDPDLFHPNSRQILDQHDKRHYKAHSIPIIPPVVVYFPPSGEMEASESAKEIQKEMAARKLWLPSDQGFVALFVISPMGV